MTIPEGRRPECRLTQLPDGTTFWRTIGCVRRVLCNAGFAAEARTFVQRANELDVNDEDTTELLGLVTEYVEIA